jgi:hypothetical protein
MKESVWTFCRKCAWHSTGTFEKCPECGNEKVNVVDNKPLLDEQWAADIAGKEKRG